MGKKARKIDHKPVIVDRVACDWLALTTYSEWAYREWYAIAEKMGVSQPARAAFKQYTGVAWDEGISIVEGSQQKGAHYIFTASGAVADEALRHIREWASLDLESLKCIRIDVQITIAPVKNRPELIDLCRSCDRGEFGEFLGRGKPKTKAHYSEDGQTFEIGSRYSDVFARIYDKKIRDRGGIEWMAERYEVEFKETRAQALFTRIMNTPVKSFDKPMREALKAHIERLPPALAVYIAAAGVGDWDVGALMPRHTPRGKSKRAEWVETISDALARAAQAGGDEGKEVRRTLFQAWARGALGDGVQDIDGHAIVAPNGDIYNTSGVAYTKVNGNNGVTIANVNHSTIEIGSIVGRDMRDSAMRSQTNPETDRGKEESNGNP